MAARDRMDALKRGGAGIHDSSAKGPGSEPSDDGLRRRERVHVPDDSNLFHVGLSHDEVHAIFFEMVDELLSLLDGKYRTVALMRFRGYTIAAIAEQMGVSTRTKDLLKSCQPVPYCAMPGERAGSQRDPRWAKRR
jgi:ECF sigma factor